MKLSLPQQQCFFQYPLFSNIPKHRPAKSTTSKPKPKPSPKPRSRTSCNAIVNPARARHRMLPHYPAVPCYKAASVQPVKTTLPGPREKKKRTASYLLVAWGLAKLPVLPSSHGRKGRTLHGMSGVARENILDVVTSWDVRSRVVLTRCEVWLAHVWGWLITELAAASTCVVELGFNSSGSRPHGLCGEVLLLLLLFSGILGFPRETQTMSFQTNGTSSHASTTQVESANTASLLTSETSLEQFQKGNQHHPPPQQVPYRWFIASVREVLWLSNRSHNICVRYSHLTSHSSHPGVHIPQLAHRISRYALSYNIPCGPLKTSLFPGRAGFRTLKEKKRNVPPSIRHFRSSLRPS